MTAKKRLVQITSGWLANKVDAEYLSDEILKEFVRKADIEVCDCIYYGREEFENCSQCMKGIVKTNCKKCNGTGIVGKGE